MTYYARRRREVGRLLALVVVFAILEAILVLGVAVL
jgi:hypothetical protein